MDNSVLLEGDCLEVLKELPNNSMDSLVTDPPAGIGFMGKEWDHHKGGRKEWCAWMESVMRECLRVLKPGAHGLVWALPRTSHWTATALEDAGFEIRDCVYHLFGSGFPKSLDVSKAIDKAAGAERINGAPQLRPDGSFRTNTIKSDGSSFATGSNDKHLSLPATDAAKQWQGFGTALKPAVECWWLVRKPISEKTVAANVPKWGTGALNIDGSRIGTENTQRTQRGACGFKADVTREVGTGSTQGRFPANLLLSCDCEGSEHGQMCAVHMLDAQSGTLKSGGNTQFPGRGTFPIETQSRAHYKENGGASRFFYCAKISSSERNAGLEGMPDKELATSTGQTRPNAPARLGSNPDGRSIVKNHHPTVKPQKLMRYLARLITPPGGIVLDPFMGSGSTGLAAKSEGFGFVGIEREAEYFEIASRRIENGNTGSNSDPKSA